MTDEPVQGIPVAVVLDQLAQTMHRARNRYSEGNYVAASNELTSAATLLTLISRGRKWGARLTAEEVDHHKKLNDEWNELDDQTEAAIKRQRQLSDK